MITMIERELSDGLTRKKSEQVERSSLWALMLPSSQKRVTSDRPSDWYRVENTRPMLAR